MASQVPPSKLPTPYNDRPAPPSSDLEQPADYRQTFQGRHAASKFLDPCEEASKASLDCMERAHYNRNECLDFFRAYRECKAKWLQQRRDDRRAGRPTH